MASNDTYYAWLPPEELAKNRLAKIEQVRASRRATDFARRLHRNWLQYYGLNDWKASISDNLYAEGPNGERVALRANHLRNALRHIHQLVTSARPDLSAKAANMDIKSLRQVAIADAIIQHYLDFENVWTYVDRAVEHAEVLHAGYIHGRWDPNKGEPWAPTAAGDGNPQGMAFQGDFIFSNPSEFDVIYDQMAPCWEDLNDLIVREWYSKYELAVKYPEHADRILRQKTRREWEVYDSLPLVFFTTDESIQIELYHYYHERTDAVPKGRKTLFLSDGTVLEDDVLGYGRVPVFRVCESEILGTAHGWCTGTELASVQESIDKTLSTIATNQFAFGVSNIWAPRGSRLEVAQLSGGLNLIEGSPVGPNGGKPEVLNLLSTPEEIFKFYELQVKIIETLSGVNEVVRGNPQQGLTAGVALALVQTQALSFMAPLQRSYGVAARDLMKFIIDTLKEKATTPRMLHMIGTGRKEAIVYFTAGDIDGVNRIALEIGNQMMQTPAGRMQFAQSLIEAGVQLTPAQLLEVWEKGRLEPLTKGMIDQLDNIILENEEMRDGKPVPVMAGDDDVLHLREHILELQNPDIRRELGAKKALMLHINEHVSKYQIGDLIVGILTGAIPPGYVVAQQQAQMEMEMQMGAAGGDGKPGKPGKPGEGPKKPPGQGGRQAPPAKTTPLGEARMQAAGERQPPFPTITGS